MAVRQDALVQKFDKEIAALTNAVYVAAKAAGTPQAFNAARVAEKLGAAFERKQKLELANEAVRTRRELGEFYGAGPRPCLIVVHQVQGVSFDAPNDAGLMEVREKVRHCVAATRAIMRQQLGDGPKVHLAIEEALTRLKFDAEGSLIDGVDDVQVTMIDTPVLEGPTHGTH